MTMTAHRINSHWEMESFMLETKSMDESRTAAHIAQTLGEVADAFSIPTEKRVAIVRNNAGNMVLCTKTRQKESC